MMISDASTRPLMRVRPLARFSSPRRASNASDERLGAALHVFAVLVTFTDTTRANSVKSKTSPPVRFSSRSMVQTIVGSRERSAVSLPPELVSKNLRVAVCFLPAR